MKMYVIQVKKAKLNNKKIKNLLRKKKVPFGKPKIENQQIILMNFNSI